MITAYGAAAPYSRALLADQNAVASVVVPVGASSRVAVSSVTTARKTSAAPAPRPGASRGRVIRRNRSSDVDPSEAATSSYRRGDCSTAARTVTTARGRKSTAYAASSTGTVW